MTMKYGKDRSETVRSQVYTVIFLLIHISLYYDITIYSRSFLFFNFDKGKLYLDNLVLLYSGTLYLPNLLITIIISTIYSS